MSKRFTRTERWQESWFQRLPARLKCFSDFLDAHCDASGVWDPNYEFASFVIGETVAQIDLLVFGSRVRVLENGKVYLTYFVKEQYGELVPTCKPHLRVISLLKEHGVHSVPLLVVENPPPPKGYPKGIDTLKDKEEEEEEVQEKEQEGGSGGKPEVPGSPESGTLEPVNEPLPEEAKIWNSKEGLPKVLRVHAKRKATLTARRRDKYFLVNFEEALRRLCESDWCRGKNDRQWVADFDFFIRPGTVEKLMEGKYANPSGSVPGSGAVSGKPADVVGAQIHGRTEPAWAVKRDLENLLKTKVEELNDLLVRKKKMPVAEALKVQSEVQHPLQELIREIKGRLGTHEQAID